MTVKNSSKAVEQRSGAFKNFFLGLNPNLQQYDSVSYKVQPSRGRVDRPRICKE